METGEREEAGRRQAGKVEVGKREEVGRREVGVDNVSKLLRCNKTTEFLRSSTS